MTLPREPFNRLARLSLMGAVLFIPLGLVPVTVCLYLMLIFWLLAGGFRHRYQFIKDSPVVWAVLLLFALTCIGAIHAHANPVDLKVALSKNAKLLFLPIALSLLDDRRWADRALSLFTASMLLVLALSVLSVFISIPGIRSDAYPVGPNGQLVRDYVVFKDHIVQNLMMSLLTLVALVRAASSPAGMARRVWALVALVAAFDILFLVHGRTGYLTLLAIVLLVMGTWLPRRFRLPLGAGLCAALLLAYLSVPVLQHRVNEVVTAVRTIGQENFSAAGQRLEFYEKTIELIRERPLSGWGTGSYTRQFCRVVDSPQWCSLGGFHPHNQLLLYGVQLGVVGMLAYLWFLMTPWFEARAMAAQDRTLLRGLALILLISSLFNAPLFFANEANFFLMMLAVLLARGRVAHSTGPGPVLS